MPSARAEPKTRAALTASSPSPGVVVQIGVRKNPCLPGGSCCPKAHSGQFPPGMLRSTLSVRHVVHGGGVNFNLARGSEAEVRAAPHPPPAPPTPLALSEGPNPCAVPTSPGSEAPCPTCSLPSPQKNHKDELVHHHGWVWGGTESHRSRPYPPIPTPHPRVLRQEPLPPWSFPSTPAPITPSSKEHSHNVVLSSGWVIHFPAHFKYCPPLQ